MSSTLITVTLPTQREDKTPATPTDVSSVLISKSVGPGAFAPLTTLHGPFTTLTVQFTDSSPDVGQDDNYEAVCTDNNGVVGDVSAVATESVPQLAKLSAPTVALTFQP